MQNKAIEAAYEKVPYPTQPTRSSHPENLAAVAAICGLKPPSLAAARVLEIGCGSGENLISIAANYSSAVFSGIDLSGSAVERGNKIVKQIGLSNVRLIKRDILDVDRSLGEFDFIICHGIYSWVPEPVRRKLFAIFQENLSSHGLAFLSYNCLPGWHRRIYARDLIFAAFGNGASQPEDMGKARAALAEAIKILSFNENAWAQTLREELETANQKPDWYLLHDYLAPENRAFYFHEVVRMAREHSVNYVADAEVAKNLPQEAPPEARKFMLRDNPTIEILEQRMDIYRNTMFRRSIFAKQAPPPVRQFLHDSVSRFLIASSLTSPPEGVPEGASRFSHRHGGALEVASSDLKSALKVLGDAWPKPLRFDEILGRAGAAQSPDFGEKLKSLLLRGYLAGLLDFYCEEPALAFAVAARPTTGAFVSHQLRAGGEVNDLRGDQVQLSEEEAALLKNLDGTRGAGELARITGLAEAKVTELLGSLLRKCLLR